MKELNARNLIRTASKNFDIKEVPSTVVRGKTAFAYSQRNPYENPLNKFLILKSQRRIKNFTMTYV